MEQTQHKIITFLTRNAHLDVEMPDIAFHLKLDEKAVQSTLDSLLEMGIVSVKQNQYGRTYWYYVPQRSTMPFETMITKIPEELSESIENQSAVFHSSSRFALVALIVSTGTFCMLVACSVWFFIQMNENKSNTTEEYRNRITQEDLTTVVETTEARIGRVECELKKTMVKVDSLKKILLESKPFESSVTLPPPKKNYRRK